MSFPRSQDRSFLPWAFLPLRIAVTVTAAHWWCIRPQRTCITLPDLSAWGSRQINDLRLLFWSFYSFFLLLIYVTAPDGRFIQWYKYYLRLYNFNILKSESPYLKYISFLKIHIFPQKNLWYTKKEHIDPLSLSFIFTIIKI